MGEGAAADADCGHDHRGGQRGDRVKRGEMDLLAAVRHWQRRDRFSPVAESVVFETCQVNDRRDSG
jgi:hypothetical protein